MKAKNEENSFRSFNGILLSEPMQLSERTVLSKLIIRQCNEFQDALRLF
jgi:hypothetical protein